MTTHKGPWILVIAGVGVVTLWRMAAYVWPSSMIEIAGDLRVPTLLLGLLFVFCGAYTYRSRPNRWTLVFLVYCLGGGVHWGGSIGGVPAQAELSLLFVYLVFTAIADAALLHLALIYPQGRAIASFWRIALYAPALAASLFVPAAGFLPESVLEIAVATLLVAANALSIVGGGVVVVRAFLVDARVRRNSRLGFMAGGILIGGAVPIIGEIATLPGGPDVWNLLHGVIPLTFAIAFTTAEGTGPDAVVDD